MPLEARDALSLCAPSKIKSLPWRQPLRKAAWYHDWAQERRVEEIRLLAKLGRWTC